MKPENEGVVSAVLGQPCLNVCSVLCLPESFLSPEPVPVEFSEPRAWVVNKRFGSRTLSPLKMRIMAGDVVHLRQFPTDTGSAR